MAIAQVVYLATLGSTLQPLNPSGGGGDSYLHRAYFAAHLLKARNTRQDEHGGLLEKSCQGCRQLLRAVLDPDTFLIGLAMAISVINIGCSIETNNALQM